MSHFRSLTIFDLLTVRHFIRKDLPGNLQCPARLSDFYIQHTPANPVDPLLRSAGQKSVASVIVLVVSDQCHGPCRRSMQRRAMSRTASWVFEPISLLASARRGCYRDGTRTWVRGEHTERAELHAHPVPRRVVAIAVDMNVSWAHSGDESSQACCCKRFRKCSHLDVVHRSICGSGIFSSRSQACNRSSMSSMKRLRPCKLSGMKDEVHRF